MYARSGAGFPWREFGKDPKKPGWCNSGDTNHPVAVIDAPLKALHEPQGDDSTTYTVTLGAYVAIEGKIEVKYETMDATCKSQISGHGTHQKVLEAFVWYPEGAEFRGVRTFE